VIGDRMHRHRLPGAKGSGIVRRANHRVFHLALTAENMSVTFRYK
jgi:hypothetical protein